jgi:hypothetical protein
VANDPKAAAPPVKKVKPYPFDASLAQNGTQKPVEVLFLNKDGMIVRLNKVFVHPGEHHQIQFELPVSGGNVFSQVRVMKTYDKAMDAKVKQVERMAELRFENLTDDQKAYIFSFLSAIGQK